MTASEDVLSFWVNEVGPTRWYIEDDELDAQIRDRFGALWQQAREGKCCCWMTSARGALGYIILTDQMPRNMFRGSGQAFATDKLSRAASKFAIDRGWDLKVAEPERQFFYLPLMHSENLCDQERCVRLMCERMSESGASNLLHARAHREVIRKFGRFPYRNDALDRAPTESERVYVAQGGYGSTVREIQQAVAV